MKLPRKPKAKHKYLTGSQVELLVSQSRQHGTIVLFLAYTGLRWGEATGLLVGALNFERRRALVDENAVKVGQVIHVGSTKGDEKRSVPFPLFLDPLLADECIGKTQQRLVFGNGLTHLKSPHSISGWFVGAVRRCQSIDPTFPTITPHDLRHTAASLAISAGANVKALQRMLGHASAAMTLDIYADLFEDDLDDVSERLNQMRSNTFVGFSWAIEASRPEKTP